MISFSFDDGWRNQYTRGLPILEKYGILGTFYLITKIPEYMLHEGEGRITQQEWKLLQQKGHEIGAHSRTHPNLHLCFPWKIINEVKGSKEDLKSVGIVPSTFAYPYGNRNWIVDTITRRYFPVGRLADGGIMNIHAKIRRESLTSVCIGAEDSFEKIATLIDQSLDSNMWLILVFHQIENNPPAWGCTPEIFEKICAYVKEKDIQIVTVTDGVQYLTNKV